MAPRNWLPRRKIFFNAYNSPLKGIFRFYQEDIFGAKALNSIIRSAYSSSSPHRNCKRQMNINILSIFEILHWIYKLGPANPWLTYIAKETLGFRRSGFSPDLRLLGPTFSLPNTPSRLTAETSQQLGMLFYHTTAQQWKHEILSSKHETNSNV